MTRAEQSALACAALAAKTILESSGETYRAEETALRMAEALGLSDVQIMAFPTGFVISALMDGVHQSQVFRVSERSIRLDRIDRVNQVSRQVAQGQLTASQAHDAITALRQEAAPPIWLSALRYALAAAFFTVMFGGRVAEFIISLCVGYMVALVQTPLQRIHIPGQLRSFILGMLSAFLSVMVLSAFSANQEAVITGVIMPLLPGLAMTNAIRDTMRGDLLSGLARGTEALVSAVLLSAGVVAGLLIRSQLWIS